MDTDVSWMASLRRSADSLIDRIVGSVRAANPALLIGAALFAYLNQPLIRFVDVYPVYEGALITTLALVLLTTAMTFKRDWLSIVFGVFAFFIGTMWIADAIEVAAKRAVLNDQRCVRIETEMLSAKPPRNDLPEIYQALNCRPVTSLYQPIAP